MTGKPVSLPPDSKDGRLRRGAAAPTAAGPDDGTLIQGLERLREGLFQRLELIETLALEQAQLLEQDASEREQALRERVSVLEAAQARLQAEAKRKEQEWQAVLQQLDADRTLLAESWERLEREQLETPHGSPPATPAARTVSEHAPAPRTPAEDPSDDAVTRTILRQFQALKGDVRRNAKEWTGR